SISSSITETHNDRILNFYKTTPIPNGADDSPRHPLEGITFDIYFVAEFKEYLSGQIKLPDATEYETPSAADFTLVTNQDGRVSINLTQKGMPDGVYLVVEREHPAIKAPVDPFYVIMPATNAEGTGYDYEITVQPKNEVKGNVRIEKDVISLGTNSASVDAYEAHTWIIGTNIPEDIANGKSFVISDTLDPRLDYIGNMRVQVETADGKTVVTTLEEGKDYILQVTDSDSMTAQTPSDAFSITLTPVGMVHVGGSMGEDSVENYMFRVYFDAQINGNAKVDEDIPNEATLDYTNSVNFDFSAKSDKPVVKTGAAKILKVDGNEHSLLLPGAEFEVYRNATEQEVAAGEGLHYIPGSIAPMVKVSFFD
ncbi:MAG: SpaH/EbpB family LPXTG-anchored major pilin, partial [Oscillospiraceae bacterium]|nr:SpaH/EbpB family LPXTG-anchored major pilin [Oscillospiraceae bacterium]